MPRARKADPARVIAGQQRELRKVARDALRVRRGELASARVELQDLVRGFKAKRKAAVASIRNRAAAKRAELRATYRAKLAALRDEVRASIAAVRAHQADAKAAKRAEVELRRSAVQRAKALVDSYLTAAQRGARANLARQRAYFAEAIEQAEANIAHEFPASVPAFRKYARTKTARQDYARALAALKARHPRGDYHPADAGEALAVWWIERMAEKSRSGQSHGEEESAALLEMAYVSQEEALGRCDEQMARAWERARSPAEQAEVEALYEACRDEAWRKYAPF